jgi:RimJ/RimL family protein N-acetyltransferase
VHIREAKPDDATAIIELTERIYSETTFMLFEKGELTRSAETFAKHIEEGLRTKNQLTLIAETGNELVGVLFGNRGGARRNRHSLYLVIGVSKAYWRRGVGRALLTTMESWALANGVHRLDLTVQARNSAAKKLYETLGYTQDGVKRHTLKIGGQYFDELLMSKLLDA